MLTQILSTAMLIGGTTTKLSCWFDRELGLLTLSKLRLSNSKRTVTLPTRLSLKSRLQPVLLAVTTGIAGAKAGVLLLLLLFLLLLLLLALATAERV